VTRGRAVVLAGVVAGVVSTLVQIVLWLAAGNPFPAILYRDARLAAAIVSGPSVLQPADAFDARIMLLATAVHFVLSVVFAGILAPIVERRSTTQALVRGAAFGVALYAVDLHLMTLVSPWFEVSRGAITLAAHVAFGVSAALACAALRPRDVR